MDIKADGYIDSAGKLKIDTDQCPIFLDLIAEQRGKSVTVTVSVEGKARSSNQNRYYYGVVVALVQHELQQEWGELLTKEDVHELLKKECNWKEVINDDTGESLKVPVSTADLNTQEFEDYLERCRRFALMYLNIDIPLPNEQIEIKL